MAFTIWYKDLFLFPVRVKFCILRNHLENILSIISEIIIIKVNKLLCIYIICVF